MSFSRRRSSLLAACVLVRLLRFRGLRIVVLLWSEVVLRAFLFPQPVRLRNSNADSGDVWVRHGCGGREAAARVRDCLGSLSQAQPTLETDLHSNRVPHTLLRKLAMAP